MAPQTPTMAPKSSVLLLLQPARLVRVINDLRPPLESTVFACFACSAPFPPKSNSVFCSTEAETGRHASFLRQAWRDLISPNLRKFDRIRDSGNLRLSAERKYGSGKIAKNLLQNRPEHVLAEKTPGRPGEHTLFVGPCEVVGRHGTSQGGSPSSFLRQRSLRTTFGRGPVHFPPCRLEADKIHRN